MRKKAVIFGTGPLGELASFYLENDSDYDVVAFCETTPKVSSFSGKPVVDFATIEQHFPPATHALFVAVGYRSMNAIRKRLCAEARSKGYQLLSYISSKATFWNHQNTIGDNVFIFEDNTIQPFVSIGDGTILWSGNHIGHHTTIGSYCFITSHVVVSGFCKVQDQCFLGVNATLADGVSLGEKTLVGAGALVNKGTSDGSTVVGHKGTLLNKKSEFFLR